MKLSYNELYEKYKLLKEENKQLKNEVISLRRLLSGESSRIYNAANSGLNNEHNSNENINLVTMHSPNKDKIELFKSLFRGRVDVFINCRFVSCKICPGQISGKFLDF
ncbi:MAG: hypothetical protein AB7V48_00965 [Sedimentibacter sp.]